MGRFKGWLGAILAAAAALGAAPTASANDPRPPNVAAPGATYTLSMARPNWTVQQTAAAARLTRVGPMAGYVWDTPAPYVAPTGKVEFLAGRTGLPNQTHVARCAIDGPVRVRFEQYRATGSAIDTPFINVTGKLAANKVVADGDDGVVDHQFNFEFVFGTNPRDVIIVRTVEPAQQIWRFRHCAIMVKGGPVPFPIAAPIPWSAPTGAYVISASKPRYRATIDGVTHEAGLAWSFTGVQYEHFAEDGVILRVNQPVPSGSMVALRVVRLGAPGQLHRLFCRTTSATLQIDHHRPKAGVKTITEANHTELFESGTAKLGFNFGGWRTFNYDFFFGPTGQDLLQLRFDAAPKALDYCIVATSPAG